MTGFAARRRQAAAFRREAARLLRTPMRLVRGTPLVPVISQSEAGIMLLMLIPARGATGQSRTKQVPRLKSALRQAGTILRNFRKSFGWVLHTGKGMLNSFVWEFDPKLANNKKFCGKTAQIMRKGFRSRFPCLIVTTTVYAA